MSKCNTFIIMFKPDDFIFRSKPDIILFKTALCYRLSPPSPIYHAVNIMLIIIGCTLSVTTYYLFIEVSKI